MKKISEGDRSIRGDRSTVEKNIRGRQKYQRATVEKIYQRVKEVSEGRSIRGLQWKKYQMATEVSEGDRSIRGRQLKKISEGDRSIRG